MTLTYSLTGLCCANCAAKIERQVSKLKQVEDANLNFMTSKLFVDTNVSDVSPLEDEILAIIKKVEPEVVVTRG